MDRDKEKDQTSKIHLIPLSYIHLWGVVFDKNENLQIHTISEWTWADAGKRHQKALVKPHWIKKKYIEQGVLARCGVARLNQCASCVSVLFPYWYIMGIEVYQAIFSLNALSEICSEKIKAVKIKVIVKL